MKPTAFYIISITDHDGTSRNFDGSLCQKMQDRGTPSSVIYRVTTVADGDV